MKKLIFLGACLVALASSPVRAQAGASDVVVVRAFDDGGHINVIISHGNGKFEKVLIASGNSDRHLVESAEGYQQMVAKLYQAGYSLKSTFTVPSSVVTMVFVKGQ